MLNKLWSMSYNHIIEERTGGPRRVKWLSQGKLVNGKVRTWIQVLLSQSNLTTMVKLIPTWYWSQVKPILRYTDNYKLPLSKSPFQDPVHLVWCFSNSKLMPLCSVIARTIEFPQVVTESETFMGNPGLTICLMYFE